MSKFTLFYNVHTNMVYSNLWTACEEEVYRRYHPVQDGGQKGYCNFILPINEFSHVTNRKWVETHIKETCDILGLIPMRTRLRVELKFRLWLVRKVTNALTVDQ